MIYRHIPKRIKGQPALKLITVLEDHYDSQAEIEDMILFYSQPWDWRMVDKYFPEFSESIWHVEDFVSISDSKKSNIDLRWKK